MSGAMREGSDKLCHDRDRICPVLLAGAGAAFLTNGIGAGRTLS